MCNLLMQDSSPILPLCLCLKERQIEFVSLPFEILAQVFTHLDFPSLRVIRLTCKALYFVTKTRQFWYNHINELTKVRHITPPEETFDDYSVEELEKWTLRRARAVDVFFNAEQPRFHKRTVDLRPEGLSELEPWNFKLLPGGRWLLVSHPPSAVLYFLDLDCPDPAPRLLFDPKEIDDEIHELERVRFSIWIDKGSPRLSFRLAFLVEGKNIFRTYTSQIDLVGHGINAILVISNIAMLGNFNLAMWSRGMALNDRYLVQVWCDQSAKARIRVYNYCEALGCPDYSISHHDSDYDVFPGMMESICDNIFAIQCIRLCSLFIFEVEPSASLKLLHRIRMDSYVSSTPRWTPRVTFATMVNRSSLEIQGFVIPHDPSRPPASVTLGRCNMDRGRGHTLGTWVVVAHDNPYKVFSHDWDFNPPARAPPSLTYLFQEDLMNELLKFDEDTGRFLGYQLQWQLVIYDII